MTEEYNYRAKGYQYVFQTEDKAKARLDTIITAYREIAGRPAIPVDRQYWCLCAEQTHDPLAEIVQLSDSGLIVTNQYHGVDRDPLKIKSNQTRFPNANWYCGEWVDVVETSENFNPAIVYFDTLNIVNNVRVCKHTARTMQLCPPQTLLTVNLMLNNPYGGTWHEIEDFVKGLKKVIGRADAALWSDLDKRYYTYRTHGLRTWMATLWFWKN